MAGGWLSDTNQPTFRPTNQPTLSQTNLNKTGSTTFEAGSGGGGNPEVQNTGLRVFPTPGCFPRLHHPTNTVLKVDGAHNTLGGWTTFPSRRSPETSTSGTVAW